jgi:hypothetical protein
MGCIGYKAYEVMYVKNIISLEKSDDENGVIPGISYGGGRKRI